MAVSHRQIASSTSLTLNQTFTAWGLKGNYRTKTLVRQVARRALNVGVIVEIPKAWQ